MPATSHETSHPALPPAFLTLQNPAHEPGKGADSLLGGSDIGDSNKLPKMPRLGSSFGKSTVLSERLGRRECVAPYFPDRAHLASVGKMTMLGSGRELSQMRLQRLRRTPIAVFPLALLGFLRISHPKISIRRRSRDFAFAETDANLKGNIFSERDSVRLGKSCSGASSRRTPCRPVLSICTNPQIFSFFSYPSSGFVGSRSCGSHSSSGRGIKLAGAQSSCSRFYFSPRGIWFRDLKTVPRPTDAHRSRGPATI